MTELEIVETRYREWCEKLIQRLTTTRGEAPQNLLKKVMALKLETDLLSYRDHAKKLTDGVVQCSNKKYTLRWLWQLERQARNWHELFESLISSQGVETSGVLRALLKDKVSVDDALELIRG